MVMKIQSLSERGETMKKKLKISYNAPVVLSFVLICCIVTLIGVLTNNRSTEMFFSTYRSAFTNPITYIRLVTHVFGHSGFEHFIGNAMYLLLIGPMLEEKYGSNLMIKIIVGTAVITGVIHCALWNSYSLCGASGIVFAFILLSSFTAFKDGEIPMSFILVTALYIGKELYAGIAVRDNISNLTHIIGGIIGCIAGYSLNKKK